MDLFLKILGVLALLALLGIASVLFFLWWKIRSIARQAFSGMPPSTIDLVEEPDPAWTKEETPAADLATLASLGYARGPAYEVQGIAGVRLVGLAHPGTGAHVAYYQHSTAGNWADFCATRDDGLELIVTSAPIGEQMDTRPETKKVYRKGAALPELDGLLRELQEGRALRPVPLERFADEFKSAYARDMAWRNQKDGTSEAEFRRIAATGDRSFTDEQLREAFKQTKLQEIQLRAGEALEKFAATTTLSVADWKKHEGRMVVYRENFHPAAYLDYLAATLTIEDENLARYLEALNAGLSLKGLMQRIGSDTGQEFVPLGRVIEPLELEIFGVTEPVEKPV